MLFQNLHQGPEPALHQLHLLSASNSFWQRLNDRFSKASEARLLKIRADSDVQPF
jgi:hypothetical protein